MSIVRTLALAILGSAASFAAHAQSATNMRALRGLAPVAALPNTPEGRAALDANLAVTGAIQAGTQTLPYLLPFAEQQQLALRDAFITDGNATQLADGLGSRLGGFYQARARHVDRDTFTAVASSITDLIGYTNNVTKSDSNAGKFFFANATTDGKKPVSEGAAAILAETGGATDVFGRAYGRLAGTPGSDAFGNARPFQTLPVLLAYRGADYFGRPSHSVDWLRGPLQNLTDSPSYPSGHTTYGYTESLLLAILVPERYRQMIVRASEYGTNRVVLGAHYAMDVLGGRAVSLHAVAHLLANDPAYVGRPRRNPAVENGMGQAERETVQVTDFPALVRAARADLTAFLERECGAPVATCATQDEGRFKDEAANRALYDASQTYGLPVVHPAAASRAVDVGQVAPEAGHLLTAAFPKLSLAEANAILTETLGPGGGFLDDGSAFGLYSRLDLYAAAGKAAALSASR